MEAVFHILGYLKCHDRSTMVFDDTYLLWNDTYFPSMIGMIFTMGHVKNPPPNAPPPRGLPVQINAFFDASHARNRLNCHSHTGILIYLNLSPTLWYSKVQKTIETSTFGSEFVALHLATELIRGLHYKLGMFGVPINRLANIFVDNDAMIKNATIPSSV
jgi:hypothetical protein